MQYFIEKISSGQDLTMQEAEEAMKKMVTNAQDEDIYNFLKASNEKGETSDEIAGFSKALGDSSIKFRCEMHEDIIDVCGTGGDGLDTFNVSTAAAIVASYYVNVAKHGNRAASSRCGSADVMEELGVNVGCSVEASEKALKETGLCFLYAPKYHPALKKVAEVRRRVGRSVFNILGPLCNPLDIDAQLLGVYSEGLMEKVADALAKMGRRCIVVHGYPGMDEVSICGSTKVFEREGHMTEAYTISPEDYRIARAELSAINGGDKKKNAEIIMGVLRGERSPYRDAVVINSAAAIYIGREASSIEEGIDLAEYSIDSGHALNNLEELRRISNL